MVDGMNALAHFLRRERTVLVVPAVAGAVGRGDVELHQVDVLADGVGRRVDLEVVHGQRVGHEVAGLVGDAVPGVGPEEQRLRRLDARAGVDDVLDVLFQRDHARLRVEPPVLVDRELGLDEGRLVAPRGCADRAGVGERRAGLRLAAVDPEHRLGGGRCLAGHGSHALGQVAAPRAVAPVGVGGVRVGALHRPQARYRCAPGMERHRLLFLGRAGVGRELDRADGFPHLRQSRQRVRVLGVYLGGVDARGEAPLGQGLVHHVLVDQPGFGHGRLGAVGAGRALAAEVMARQAAVDDLAVGADVHVQRGLRRPVAGLAGDIEGVARELGRGHGRQGRTGQRHQRGVDDAAGHFGIRQGAAEGMGAGVEDTGRAVLKHVVHAPELPHALREVRVQVAMEDAVARGQVAVAGATEGDFIRKTGPWGDGLRIEVGAAGLAGVHHPLVGVQVEHVRFLGARVQVAEAHRVVQVRMVDVGRIVRVEGADRRLARGIPLQHQRRVAVGPAAEEELLGAAFAAVARRAGLAVAGHDHGAHAAGAVVDAHAVLQVMQRVLRVLQLGEGLHGLDLVVQDHGEFAERVAAAVAEAVVLAVPVGPGGVVAVGRRAAWHHHRVQVAVHDALAVQHGQDGATLERSVGIPRAVVEDFAVGMAGRARVARGQPQIVVRDLRAVPDRAARFHVDGAEQAQPQLPAIAFATHRGGVAVGEEGAFAQRAEVVDGALARMHRAALGLQAGF